jgi:hypothetical protein
MAPVVVVVNAVEHYAPNDGRHEGGPYNNPDRQLIACYVIIAPV